MLKITVERFFTENDNFCERYIVKNLRDSDVFIVQDNFGIMTPFNDCYPSADECMLRRCNTHVWCGKNTSYVNALRMGESDINLGLILTKGKLLSYSIEDCESDTRGIFVLNSDFFTLKYLNEGSPLYGAFLIYDCKEKHPVFDDAFGDHNACRERVGMALLLARYLQRKKNAKFEKALDLYIEFVKREFYDDWANDQDFALYFALSDDFE